MLCWIWIWSLYILTKFLSVKMFLSLSHWKYLHWSMKAQRFILKIWISVFVAFSHSSLVHRCLIVTDYRLVIWVKRYHFHMKISFSNCKTYYNLGKVSHFVCFLELNSELFLISWFSLLPPAGLCQGHAKLYCFSSSFLILFKIWAASGPLQLLHFIIAPAVFGNIPQSHFWMWE